MRLPLKLPAAALSLILILAALPAASAAQRARDTGWTVAETLEIDVEGAPGAVSPDGAWIAGRGEDDSLCLWETPALTEHCRDEVDHVDESSIAWSPNGRYIAFAQAGAGFDSDIFLFDLRTQTLINLTDDRIDEMGNPEEGGKYGTFDQDPVWSPAGDEILFRRSNQPLLDQDFVALMRVRLETGQVIRVHDIVADEPFTMLAPPLWLPDDTILFSVWENAEVNGLWRVGVNGAEPHRIPLSYDERALAMPMALAATPEGDRVLIHAWDRYENLDPDRLTNYWLDLDRGTLGPVGASTGDVPNAQTPIRLSPDGDVYVYALGNELDATIVIEDATTGQTTVIADHAALYGWESLFGLTWTTSNQLLIPTQDDLWLLITLEPPSS